MPQGSAREAGRRWWVAPLALLAMALVVWLGIAALSPGYVADIESRKARAKWVTEEGIEDAYRMRIDYPPGNLYLFDLVGHFYQATVDPRFDRRRAAASQYLTFLIKLPPILFHLATVATVYAVARRFDRRRALLASSLLLFDPAALWDVAHQGQYDPVHTFFALLAVLALMPLARTAVGRSATTPPGMAAARPSLLPAFRPVLAGFAIALGAATKPQSWILLPLVAAYAWRLGAWSALARAVAGGAAGLFLVLLPFILNNRLSHLSRLFEYMSTNSTANHVISANAHNLWWLPTLMAGRWVDDAELLGGVPYRWIGAALVLMVLGWCLWTGLGPGRSTDSSLVAGGRGRLPLADAALLAATLGAGWFFVTPRAHEYHAFFILPFLALLWARWPRFLPLYLLGSLSLLANLALHDPVVVGALAAPPDVGVPLPGWYVLLTLVNVGAFAVLFAALAWAVHGGEDRAVAPAWREVAAAG
ncbi:MAG: hypothetical protein IT307_04325 [Chloroflexi bacterium]|nr:hypothetical protein [Chloroflexota bacterium]